eukprot:TRINITY_DN17_c0_g2_i1.p3 TRINITY_DN17_c0_g2~~TRINITY_DN17_c0_g2_i1.p3  ORF type:complete len:143 (-),score=18.59 TRINITY_DN17_c0_g2_i1:459-887(-)
MNRDLLPKLTDLNVKLFFVGIGPRTNAIKFAEGINFPQDILFADPEAACYAALQTNSGFEFLPLIQSMTNKLFKDKFKNFKEVLKGYQLSTPNKVQQVTIQGSLWVVKGEETKWLWYDKSVGDHADFEEIMMTVKQSLKEGN